VHGRALSPIERAHADLQLNISVAPKSRQASRDRRLNSLDSSVNDSSSFDFDFGFDYGNYTPLNKPGNKAQNPDTQGGNGRGQVATGLAAEMLALGLRAENSEEAPFVMNREQPTYSLDIKPTSKARAYNDEMSALSVSSFNDTASRSTGVSNVTTNTETRSAHSSSSSLAGQSILSALTVDSSDNINIHREGSRPSHLLPHVINKPSPLLLGMPLTTTSTDVHHPLAINMISGKAAVAPGARVVDIRDDISSLDPDDRSNTFNSDAYLREENRRASLEMLSMDAMDLCYSTL
jgi:hypothetical protein